MHMMGTPSVRQFGRGGEPIMCTDGASACGSWSLSGLRVRVGASDRRAQLPSGGPRVSATSQSVAFAPSDGLVARPAGRKCPQAPAANSHAPERAQATDGGGRRHAPSVALSAATPSSISSRYCTARGALLTRPSGRAAWRIKSRLLHVGSIGWAVPWTVPAVTGAPTEAPCITLAPASISLAGWIRARFIPGGVRLSSLAALSRSNMH